MQSVNEAIQDLVKSNPKLAEKLNASKKLQEAKDLSRTERFEILSATSDKCPYGECDGSGMILVRDHEYRDEMISAGGEQNKRIVFRKKDFARECRCREITRIARRLDCAQVPEEFKNATINSFEIKIYSTPHFQQLAHMAKRASINFVRKYTTFKEQGKGLYLYSHTKGSGKTRMAASIMNAIIRNYDNSKEPISAYYTPTTELLSEIKKTFNNDSKVKSDEIIDLVKKVDLLILDDIGVEKVTDWVEETFSRILDYRLQNKLVTIFTSNIPVEKLSTKYTEGRVGSRIEKMSFPIEFPNESIRSNLAKEENESIQELLLGED